MQWYYAIGRQQIGPISESELDLLVNKGTIGPDTLVWNKTMKDWTKYGDVKKPSVTEPAPSSVPSSSPTPSPASSTTPGPGNATCSQCGNTFLESDLIKYQDLLVCANCKPMFLQKIKEGVTVLGTTASDKWGSIEKGIRGEYFFSISDILSEAWDIMKGSKRYILGGTIVMYLILFFISGIFKAAQFAIVGFENPESASGIGAGFEVVSQIVTTVISYPMTAGIMMIGIRRSVGLPIDFSIVFKYFHKTIPLVLMYLLTMILVVAGFLLLIIPGIYLSVAYMMAMPLIVEKDLGIWEALETSRKAITKQWFHIFGLFIVIGLIVIASFFLLGIGLIWTIPLATVSFGILYRTIFGVEEVRGK